MQAANDSDAVNEFNKFINIFFSEKNATNREILNSLTLIKNELKNLIKINNNEIKIKYNKIRNNAKMIEKKYKKKKKKKKEKKKKEEKKDEENHEIIKISD